MDNKCSFFVVKDDFLLETYVVLCYSIINTPPPPLYNVQIEGLLLKYTKKHLSYKKQIKLLEDRNLIIKVKSFTERKLKTISYYRLSAYFYPFFYKKDIFQKDISFKQIIDLYYFDSNFRKLVFRHIEKIEVYVRNKISYVLSKDDGAFAYVKPENFKDLTKHEKILETMFRK